MFVNKRQFRKMRRGSDEGLNYRSERNFNYEYGYKLSDSDGIRDLAVGQQGAFCADERDRSFGFRLSE